MKSVQSSQGEREGVEGESVGSHWIFYVLSAHKVMMSRGV